MKRLPTTKVWKRVAQSLVNDIDNHLHVINDFVVHHYNGNFKVINKVSLQIIEHNTEQEALNHCLDFYKSSSSRQIAIKQESIFNQETNT